MLTLFRVATLEDWSDVMYINIYGCKDYDDGGLYVDYSDPDDDSHLGKKYLFGAFRPYNCVQPMAQPVISAVYFILFVIIGCYIILSLFIGAVCGGMTEAIDKMREEKRRLLRERASKEKVMNHLIKHKQAFMQDMVNLIPSPLPQSCG